MRPNPQFLAVSRFNEEIFNGKPHFLCSDLFYAEDVQKNFTKLTESYPLINFEKCSTLDVWQDSEHAFVFKVWWWNDIYLKDNYLFFASYSQEDYHKWTPSQVSLIFYKIENFGYLPSVRIWESVQESVRNRNFGFITIIEKYTCRSKNSSLTRIIEIHFSTPEIFGIL